MDKAVYSILLIIASIALGRLSMSSGLLRRLDDGRLEKIRIAAQKLVLMGFNPVIAVGAIWSLDFGDLRLLILPAVGLSAMAAGLGLGFIGSRALKLPPLRAGVYTTCASFANIGNIGGLVVFILLGEGGYALVPLYRLLEEFWNYGILFPIARSYGERARADSGEAYQTRPQKMDGFIRVLKDPFFLMSVASLTIGLALNLLGIARPTAYGSLNSLLIPAGSVLFLFTIGMRMSVDGFRSNVPTAALLAVGKAVAVPAIAFVLMASLGLGAINGGLPIKVAIILASSPVGFLGLVPPSLYRLDRNLANSIWLVSNGSLALTIPALAFLIERL